MFCAFLFEIGSMVYTLAFKESKHCSNWRENFVNKAHIKSFYKLCSRNFRVTCNNVFMTLTFLTIARYFDLLFFNRC